MFSLEMEQVKTRATVPALNIQKVEADETGNGRFIVTALPADFTPDFFTGKVSYSIALRVQKAYDAEAGNDYSANVVSDYVNLVPARADVKAVVLAPAKEDGSIDADRIVAADGEVAYEIPYDDTDMVVELMKGYKLWLPTAKPTTIWLSSPTWVIRSKRPSWPARARHSRPTARSWSRLTRATSRLRTAGRKSATRRSS